VQGSKDPARNFVSVTDRERLKKRLSELREDKADKRRKGHQSNWVLMQAESQPTRDKSQIEVLSDSEAEDTKVKMKRIVTKAADKKKSELEALKQKLAAALGKNQQEKEAIVDLASPISSPTLSPAPSEASEGEEESDPPEALEVFCGCAQYTAELQKAGFRATGIDYKGNKDKPRAKTIWLDLASRVGQLQFWDMVRTGKVKYVHFAPPCGTASKVKGS